MLRPLLSAAFLFCAAPALAAEWTYTDGAGNTVTLPDPPRRIIAHSTAAAALIPYGIRPIGILRDGPPSLDRTLDGVDIEGIPIVSRGWFEIDAEAILALEPDLIVTEYSLTEHTYQGGTHEDAISQRLVDIAPIVGVPRSTSIASILETYQGFAAELGADPSRVADDKAAFEAAVASLQTAIAENPDLTVMAVSPYASGLSIAVPAFFGELSDWSGWGLDLVSPPATPDTSYLTVSWENAGDYEADILLLDDRWEGSALDIITLNPIGARISAVAAGQTGDWPAEWIRSYAAYASEIDELTALIRRSRKLPE